MTEKTAAAPRKKWGRPLLVVGTRDMAMKAAEALMEAKQMDILYDPSMIRVRDDGRPGSRANKLCRWLVNTSTVGGRYQRVVMPCDLSTAMDILSKTAHVKAVVICETPTQRTLMDELIIQLTTKNALVYEPWLAETLLKMPWAPDVQIIVSPNIRFKEQKDDKKVTA